MTIASRAVRRKPFTAHELEIYGPSSVHTSSRQWERRVAESTCLWMMTTEYPTRRLAVWRRASRPRTRCPAVHTECSPRKSARAKDSWPVGSMRQACTRLHTRCYAERSCSISARVVGTSAGRQSSVRFCGILALCSCALWTRMTCACAHDVCMRIRFVSSRGGIACAWGFRMAEGKGGGRLGDVCRHVRDQGQAGTHRISARSINVWHKEQEFREKNIHERKSRSTLAQQCAQEPPPVHK